jgi:hypothetical protein
MHALWSTAGMLLAGAAQCTDGDSENSRQHGSLLVVEHCDKRQRPGRLSLRFPSTPSRLRIVCVC